MPTHKLYDVLGVARNSSPEQIKAAYKKLAIQNHPDKGGDSEKFKEISAAYNVLSDEGKRKEYDQIGDEGLAGGGGGGGHPFGHDMNPHDLFAHLFGGMGGGMGGGMPGMPGMHFNMGGFPGHGGGGEARQKKGGKKVDFHHEMHIPLHEAYFGAHKGIRVQLAKTCFVCVSECPACQGLGRMTQIIRNGIFTQMIQGACEACSGTGSVQKGSDGCSICNGKCKYTEEKRVDVHIPRGVPSTGFVLTMTGLGEQATSSHETPGDLHVRIIVDDDATYQRRGNDLLLKNPSLLGLTFVESIIGKVFDVQHFTGKISVNTRMFGIIDPGKEYTISGKGMPYEGDTSRYGDLAMKFAINYPSNNMSDADVAMLEEVFKKMRLF